MHFILAPVGSAGDVHPYVGLALAMRDRGHRVTFIVNSYFHDTVARYGFDQVEFGTAEEFLRAANNPNLWHPRRALPHIVKEFIEPYSMLHYETVVDNHEEGAVVLTSCLGVGALMAQDKHDIPVITVHLQPGVIWSDISPPKLPGMIGPAWARGIQYWLGRRLVLPWIMTRPINKLRARIDLPPIRDVFDWWHSKSGVVCLFPEWFCPPAPDWPPVLQSDFPLWDAGQEQELDDSMEAFLVDGDPPIVFTPGSANIFGSEFFRESIEACSQIGRRALLLTKFQEQIPQNLPQTVGSFAYAPFGKVLPRCAALVHHGGVGSTAQAFRAGIPQLIMALAHDQYDNGHRVDRLGAGRWLPSRNYQAETIAPLLQEILADPIASRATAVQQLTSTDGPRVTVEMLEKHLGIDEAVPIG